MSHFVSATIISFNNKLKKIKRRRRVRERKKKNRTRPERIGREVAPS